MVLTFGFQDRNLKVISQPYLSREEEEGHVTEQPGYAEKLQKERDDLTASKMFKHRYTKDHLQILEDSRKWE